MCVCVCVCVYIMRYKFSSQISKQSKHHSEVFCILYPELMYCRTLLIYVVQIASTVYQIFFFSTTFLVTKVVKKKIKL